MPSKPPVHRRPGIGDRKQQRRFYDQTRDTQPWRRWYKTARWLRTAKAQLDHEPLCRMCKAAGTLTQQRYATTSSVMEAIRCGSGPFQSLCASCHSSEKQRQELSSSG